MNSFLWHDYETFGTDTARDRPSQFAAIRTTPELEVIGAPTTLFCQPTVDVLPHPDAVRLTGITPQLCQREGIAEPKFAARIHALFSEPGTCGVGYNSIRFDDEVTRNLLYRNFYDPYEHQWRGDNSRWDLIDVVRLCHALRPAGMAWPRRDDGSTSFKLEHLTAANGVGHSQAHDALSDVEALIGLARKLKTAQPRLWGHALKLRSKQFAASLLDCTALTPLLHVSSRYPAARGCLAVVVPLAWHPSNNNCVITYDLGHPPEELLDLPADELQDRVFSRVEDLPEGLVRIPLKGVHTNKSPMLAPLATLDAATAERWGISLTACEQHLAQLRPHAQPLAEKVQAVFSSQGNYPDADAELAIYSGFASNNDKRLFGQVQQGSPPQWANLQGRFEAPRYNELLLRYRARHAPQTLSPAEHGEWLNFVQNKLSVDTGTASLTLPQYHALLAERLPQAADLSELRYLQALQDWPLDSGLDTLLEEANRA